MSMLGWIARIVPADERRQWRGIWESERTHARARRARREGERWGRSDGHVLAAALEDALRSRALRLAPGPLLQDVRFGLRLLRRSPGFTLVAITTLALGVGANTAIFSVVHALLLRPLGYERPDSVVHLVGVLDGEEFGGVSLLNARDYEERVDAFDTLAYVTWWQPVLQLDEPLRLAGLGVSHGYFALYGEQPHLGRYLAPDDDPLEAEPVVVLSHGLWQQELGADPDVVGRDMVLDGVPHLVVGVAPPDLRDPFADIQIWRNPPAYLGQASRAQPWLQAFARVAEGTTLERAQQEMDALSAALAEAFPGSNGDVAVRLVPLRERLVAGARPAVLTLLGAVLMVLLIACANVANLLLTRGAAREREIALRMSLGAGTTRVLRQLLTESLVLALAGGAIGIWVGWGGLLLLRGVEVPGLPEWAVPALDPTVLLFTLAITLATGVLFGLAPLRQLARTDLDRALRSSSRGSGDAAGRTRALLAVGELALATVLLIGAGLMVRSFVNLVAVDTGLSPERVLTLSVDTNRMRAAAEEHVAYFSRLRERLAALPAVEAVGHASLLPLTGNTTTYEFSLDDRPPPAPGEAPGAEARVVSADYFRVVGQDLVAGRLPDGRDDWSSPPVALVNQAFVDTWLPEGGALGVGLTVHGARHEIVGVVENTRQLGPATPPRPEIFTVYDQASTPYWMRPNADFVLRTAGDPMALADAARAAIWEVDDSVAVDDVAPMIAFLDAYHAAPRMQAALLAGFAALATLLAAIGVAGVVSYGVATRVREIGIRRALGAETGDVRWMVLRDVAGMAAAGLALGVIGAWLTTRFTASILYEVRPADPATFVSVVVALAAVTMAAGYLPARRATRIDPAIALRNE